MEGREFRAGGDVRLLEGAAARQPAGGVGRCSDSSISAASGRSNRFATRAALRRSRSLTPALLLVVQTQAPEPGRETLLSGRAPARFRAYRARTPTHHDQGEGCVDQPPCPPNRVKSTPRSRGHRRQLCTGTAGSVIRLPPSRPRFAARAPRLVSVLRAVMSRSVAVSACAPRPRPSRVRP